jgi:hypothetical protein
MGYETLFPDKIFFRGDFLVGIVNPNKPEVRAVSHLEGGEISGWIKLIILDELLR